MISKHLYFKEKKPNIKTKIWGVYSKHSDELLGQIKWYAPWRQYCYFDFCSVMARSCLRDIADFIDAHNEDRVTVGVVES